MKQIIKLNRWFLIPYVLILFICIFFLFQFKKPELHLLINQWHSNKADFFFKYLTHLGDGTLIAILFLILLFIKYRYAFTFLTGALVTSGIVNLLKRIVFDDVFRPVKYFELLGKWQLHLVEGVKMNMFYSFPSGHSATAFNIFLMLALIVKNNFLKLMFFLIASMVAFSRIYLSQHFLIDITAGSFIGILIMLVSFYWVESYKNKWLDKSMFAYVRYQKDK